MSIRHLRSQLTRAFGNYCGKAGAVWLQIKPLLRRLIKSVFWVFFRPLRTLQYLRTKQHFGAVHPWAIENILFPAPLSVAFLIQLVHHFRVELLGLFATVLFTALAWAAPRLTALIISRFSGDTYVLVESEQLYLFFLGSLPAFFFSFDSQASWIAVDIVTDGIRALRYDPLTVSTVALFSLVVVPAIQLAWCRRLHRSKVATLPGIIVLGISTFALVEFFWGLANALQNP